MRFHTAITFLLCISSTTTSVSGFAGYGGSLAWTSASPTALFMSTTSTIKRLPNSAVEIDIPVPGSATKAAYDKVCTELSKNIQIPGFRKGSRIPPQVLEQAMSAKGGRNALKVQAINELLTQLVEPALKEHALDPIGQAVLQISAEDLADTFTAGEPLTLPVQCDVWPEIQWKTTSDQDKPYIGLKGKYTRKPFNQERMDLALRDLKERYATLEPIDDPTYELKMGDACTVNMVGYLANENGEKGEPLPNAASGDNVEVILGKGRYMEGLVEGLVGGKAGETRMVSVSFPEKLRDKTLAGKKAIFDVEILNASTRTVPEVTDDFAAKVRPGLTAESLLAELRKAIDDEDKKDFVPARNKALSDALAEVMEVEVPDTLVTNQAREKFAVMMAEMRDNGVPDEEIKRQINPENFQKYKDIVKDDIIRDFKVSMAADEIVRLEGIEVPDYQIEEQLEAIKKDAGESEDFDENMIRAKVKTTMERSAVFDWLADQAQLEVEYTKEEKFDEELMEKLAQESLEREQKLAAEKAEQGKPSEPVVAETKPVEDSEPAEEKEAAPVATAAAPPAAAKKYEEMTLEEKAFQILLDTGALTLNKNPNDPDYDPSEDDIECAENTFKM